MMPQLIADAAVTRNAPRRPSSDDAPSARTHLGSLDLNLLRVLDAIVQERNLTRAGHRLGLSQPAVSHALARLRFALGDELFVRTPEGMQPTPRTQQIAQPIREALRVLRATLEPEEFDPVRSCRTFTLLVSNYAARALVPTLSHIIAEAAPRVSLDVRPVGTRNVLDQLDLGAADVALTRLVDGGDRFKCVRVTDDDYVALLDRQHPAASIDELDPEQLAAIPHMVITSSDDETQFVDDALGELGLARKVAIRAPMLSVVLLLIGADRLAIVPRRAANGLATVCQLVCKELPFASPRTELSMIWHRGLDKDPAQQWLRGMVRASVQN